MNKHPKRYILRAIDMFNCWTGVSYEANNKKEAIIKFINSIDTEDFEGMNYVSIEELKK